MKLFAFSDFHLSGDPPSKPMDIFGSIWTDHRRKIMESWKKYIKKEDTVILAGDLSWAMNLKEAESDLLMIASLPGRKIIVRGNHDYWWDTVTKMNRLTGNAFEFLHNTALASGSAALAGTRGWIPETSPAFTEKDIPILRREEERMTRSLQEAVKLNRPELIAVTHYPPFDDKRQPTRMLLLMKEYGVQECIYGHIHGETNFSNLPETLEGIRLHLTSADYLKFIPCCIHDFGADI